MDALNRMALDSHIHTRRAHSPEWHNSCIRGLLSDTLLELDPRCAHPFNVHLRHGLDIVRAIDLLLPRRPLGRIELHGGLVCLKGLVAVKGAGTDDLVVIEALTRPPHKTAAITAEVDGDVVATVDLFGKGLGFTRGNL